MKYIRKDTTPSPDNSIGTYENIITLKSIQSGTPDRGVVASKPDFNIKYKRKQQCLIIDVTIPSDYNVTLKEVEKILKYKDFQIEIQHIWNMEAKVIPIIIGAAGLLSNVSSTQALNGSLKK